jgi:hypothetical protein
MRGWDVQSWAKSTGKRVSGRWLLALVALAFALPEGSALSSMENAHSAVLSSSHSRREISVDGRIFREIRDPHSGMCWLLVRDEAHPGGPGRLVLAEETSPLQSGDRQALNRAESRQAAESFTGTSVPVIRAGDRLIVEEETPVIAARLEAVALGPAAVGGEFEVRLKMGGKVMRAVAQGPGRAALQSEREAQP